jgi:hypothetical protein
MYFICNVVTWNTQAVQNAPTIIAKNDITIIPVRISFVSHRCWNAGVALVIVIIIKINMMIVIVA